MFKGESFKASIARHEHWLAAKLGPKPGAHFAGYESCMTDKHQPSNSEHRAIKKGIEEGDALPDIWLTSDGLEALEGAGLEVLESRSVAADALVAGGQTDIFTPMLYFHVRNRPARSRKPLPPRAESRSLAVKRACHNRQRRLVSAQDSALHPLLRARLEAEGDHDEIACHARVATDFTLSRRSACDDDRSHRLRCRAEAAPECR